MTEHKKNTQGKQGKVLIPAEALSHIHNAIIASEAGDTGSASSALKAAKLLIDEYSEIKYE